MQLQTSGVWLFWPRMG